MEITKEEAKLIIDMVESVQYEGMGIGNGQEDQALCLLLVEKIFREFPDLTNTEVLEWFSV